MVVGVEVLVVGEGVVYREKGGMEESIGRTWELSRAGL